MNKRQQKKMLKTVTAAFRKEVQFRVVNGRNGPALDGQNGLYSFKVRVTGRNCVTLSGGAQLRRHPDKRTWTPVVV